MDGNTYANEDFGPVRKLAAAKAAQLREREIEEKEEFYKLTIFVLLY